MSLFINVFQLYLIHLLDVNAAFDAKVYIGSMNSESSFVRPGHPVHCLENEHKMEQILVL